MYFFLQFKLVVIFYVSFRYYFVVKVTRWIIFILIIFNTKPLWSGDENSVSGSWSVTSDLGWGYSRGWGGGLGRGDGRKTLQESKAEGVHGEYVIRTSIRKKEEQWEWRVEWWWRKRINCRILKWYSTNGILYTSDVPYYRLNRDNNFNK